MSKGRVISIDYGHARIGIAMSDEQQILANPQPTIKVEKKLEQTAQTVLKSLQALEAQGYKFVTVIVGLPIKMNGTLGSMGEEAKKFAALLEENLPVPVILWDERLTSVQAERSMREGNLTRKKRAKSVDSVAALLILQSYLDNQKNSFFPEGTA
jgi:putative Holliday junction resolvase